MNSYHLRLDPKSLVPADDNPQRMTPTMFNNLKTALAADTDTIDEPAVWKDGDHYRIISLPADIYFVSSLPMDLQITDVIAVVSVAMLLCWFSSVYPAKKAAELVPVDAIRSE